MASDTRADKFCKWVDSNALNGHVPQGKTWREARFVSLTQLQGHLTSEAVNELLDHLFPIDSERPPSQSILKDDAYIRVFATLLYIRRGALIRLFLKDDSLTDQNAPFEPYEHGDVKLPASGFSKLQASIHDELWNDFYNAQWKFFPSSLKRSRGSIFNPECIWPVYLPDRIAEGASSTVFRVRSHPGCNRLPKDRVVQDCLIDASSIVVKIFTSTMDSQFDKEEKAREVLDINRQSEPDYGLIHSFGCVRQGDLGIYLLEYADYGTLKEFLDDDRARPKTPDDKNRMWKAFMSIFGALSDIHRVRNSDNFKRRLIGVHQDIKPDNILILRSQRETPYKFKLADLGLSHFEQDDGSVPPRGSDPEEGNLKYSPPDAYYDPNPRFRAGYKRIDTSYDVWSMGCMISLFAVWMEQGAAEVAKYRQEREKMHRRLSGFNHDFFGCFHDGSELLQCVKDRHAAILRLPDVASCTSKALDLARQMLRSASERRIGSLPAFIEWSEFLQGMNAERLSRETLARSSSSVHDVAGGPFSTNNSSFETLTLGSPTVVASPLRPLAPSVMVSPPTTAPTTPVSQDVQTTSATPVSQAPNAARMLRFADAEAWLVRQRPPHYRIYELPNHELHTEIKKRDVVFLLDAHPMMQPYWSKAISLLHILSALTKDYDSDGIVLYVCGYGQGVRKPYRSRDPRELCSFAASNAPQTHNVPSNLVETLAKVLKEYTTRLQNLLSRVRSAKRITVFILTAGGFEDNVRLREPLIAFVKALEKRRTDEHHAGLQFIQFGDDARTSAILQDLDDNFDQGRDCIDHTPADGDIWKMLLGATKNSFDSLANAPAAGSA